MAGWRLWQAGQLPVTLSYDTDILHCMMTIFSQSHYHLQSGDIYTEITELRFERKGAYTSWQGINDGQFISASTVIHGKDISVTIEDERFLFSQTDYLASEKDNAMTHKLTAPMTATVTKILVKPGEAVTQGQSLVLLEAMKMEYNLKAHQSATVEHIMVNHGQGVNEGELILTFIDQQEDEQ